MTKRKSVSPIIPLDYGTNELSKRFVTKPERRFSGVVYVRVQNGNQVDAYLFSDSITPDQHSVLTGFQVDLHRASLTGPRAATMEARVSASAYDISQSEADHRLRVNQALFYINKTKGRQVVSNLLVVCMDDQPGSLSLLLQGIEALSAFRSLGHQVSG